LSNTGNSWFVNDNIFNESYVIGATRNFILDMFSFIFLIVTFAGIALHIYFRIKYRNQINYDDTGMTYLYPVWLRIWHIINALLIIILIVTGISMEYPDPEIFLIRFDLAVTWHNTTGVMLVISYLF